MCSKAARSKLAGMGVDPTWALGSSSGCQVAIWGQGGKCCTKGLAGSTAQQQPEGAGNMRVRRKQKRAA